MGAAECVQIGPAALFIGDCLEVAKGLADGSVNCCVTSPPYYGLRDYGVDGQIGLEETPDAYVERLVALFSEVRRVLRDDGTLWLNLGDSYVSSPPGNSNTASSGLNGAQGERYSARLLAKDNRNKRPVPRGLKQKDLVGIPWQVAFALRASGWWLRSDIIWAKPNPMPESITDRPTKSHEYVFLLAKAERYYYDADAIRNRNDRSAEVHPVGGAAKAELAAAVGNTDREWGRPIIQNPAGSNARTVWSISTKPCPEAHFAVMPQKLAERCILAGCPEGGTVYDPFTGAGTTPIVAIRNGRRFIGSELNPEYAAIACRRIREAVNAEKSSLFPAFSD